MQHPKEKSTADCDRKGQGEQIGGAGGGGERTHTKKHTMLLTLSEILSKIFLATLNKGSKLIP